MRSIRFHAYGEPEEVLHLEAAAIPEPGPGEVRVAVHACGLNPADWALCGGLFAGDLPRGIGLEISGTVDALGAGVGGVAVGDRVFGPAPFRGASAGAAEFAVMDTYFPVPAQLGDVEAAALPMAVETAFRGIGVLGVKDGRTVLISGAGTTVGYAAVQIALGLGARVIATAGSTYADRLRALGAEVTAYGDGLAERVTALVGGPVDLALDTAPPSGVLPALIQITRDPQNVLTLSDWAAGKELGVPFGGLAEPRHDVLPEYASLAAQGRFSVPVAQTFALDDWRTAMELSRSGHPGGKLILLNEKAIG